MIESNGSVTLFRNTNRCFTKSEKIFLEKALSINVEEKRPFSYHDFTHLSPVNFRKIIHGLKDQVVLHIKSRPCFYKIKEIDLPGDSHKVTQRVMGGEMMKLLQKLREQPPKIHDLKLKFDSDLHTHLVSRGASTHSQNHSIKVNVPYFDQNIIVKLLVYPKTVQLDIGCTFKPFIYDLSGIFELSSLLGRICGHIDAIAGNAVKYPPVTQWIITHYHFGKDGSEAYNGQVFHRTYEEFGSGLVRIYSKTMPSGEKILRAEQIFTPHITLNQELDRIVQSETLVTN